MTFSSDDSPEDFYIEINDDYGVFVYTLQNYSKE